MVHKHTLVFAGYFISREGLDEWSERREKVDSTYRRCLAGWKGLVSDAVELYLEKKNLGHAVKYQFLPKPEHGDCGRHCWNCNFIFYRRHGTIGSMAKCRLKDWKRLEEKATDLEVKKKLEETLGIELSGWTIIIWGPTGMLYDARPEMFDERGAELIEQLENGPIGPCGGNPPPLP
ncbi:hypothetical protein FRC07_014443 [Ceratobasidium sp. 392]|nr:hypothetical protein FRC07_014443 [Ceratobasidium sp. 392]